jgi:serine/threonine protein kinase
MRFLELLGEGGFGEVWKAEDELGRQLAVKLFKPGGEAVSNALDHARALARVTHPNVVRVLYVDRLAHPTTGEDVDCVVMDLLLGETLETFLQRQRLELPHARVLGLCILDGIKAIHDAGLIHGDLHPDNIIVHNGQATVIDILYRGTLAALPSGDRIQRVRSDLNSVRLLLSDILYRTNVNPGEAAQFNHALATDASFNSVRDSWLRVTDPAVAGDLQRQVQHAVRRVEDPNFVAGDAYAAAVAAETPREAALPVLLEMLRKRTVVAEHLPLLRLLFGKLTPQEEVTLFAELSAALDAETPAGSWQTPIQLVKAIGRDGWASLNASTIMRLEYIIVNDVLAGRYDMHSYPNVKAGQLGSYAKTLHGVFSNPDALLDNLISLLRQNWYTQNYVAHFFLPLLPRLATTDDKRGRVIAALRSAVMNDARLVVNRLNELPNDWQNEVHGTPDPADGPV